MAAKPGLEPGQKVLAEDQQVVTNVESDRQVAATSDNKQTAEVNTTASDNTEDTVTPEPESKSEEQPVSERLSKRVESVVNERNAEREARIAAQERARLLEEQLQRIVNVQPSQPTATLESQFRSFDRDLGYPTDPKEFSQYVLAQAREEAQKATLQTSSRSREQQELTELSKSHPDVAKDHYLQGAIVAEKQEASRRGEYLTWSQAADRVKQHFNSQIQKKVVDDAVSDTQSKNEAYIETTKGASSSRNSTPDISKMNLKEMETYLKSIGQW